MPIKPPGRIGIRSGGVILLALLLIPLLFVGVLCAWLSDRGVDVAAASLAAFLHQALAGQ